VRPLLERLEDRLTPSPLFTVTDNSDSAADTGSLRYALTNAAKLSISTIDFDLSNAASHTITLSSSNTTGLVIANNLTITNDLGDGPVTIDGGGQFTVFTINKGVTAALSGLTIANGFGGDGDGGGIKNLGALTVSDSTFSGNSASDGGGIENNGTLTVGDSTFSGNSANLGSGGGIDTNGALRVSDSTFSGNFAAGGGGGVNNNDGTVVLNGDILVGNTDSDMLPDDVNGLGVDPSSSYNLVGADVTGSLTNGQNGNQLGVTAAQVDLAPLGDYGGPTQTFALLPGSLALGAGPTETGAFDQRGFARPAGAPADAGAFQTTPLVVNTAADADAPGLLTLRDAVNIASVNTTTTAEPITFDPTVFATPQTITLTDGTLELGGSRSSVAPITITGSSAGVTIDGRGLSTVFTVNGVTASLSDLTITGDSGDAGGGIDNEGGALTVSGCTFVDNSTPFSGSGIDNDGGSVTVDDSTFSGNSAGDFGGGVYIGGGMVTVSDSTFSGNSAGVSGGGVYIGGGPGTLVLIGDILVGNTGADGADDIDGAGVDSSSSYNLVGADLTGSLVNGANGNQVGVTVAQAGLAPLADNGGPTETFALTPGSLALGAGLTATTPAYDQRGVARPVGVPGDAGAYQAVYPPTDVQLAFSASVTEQGFPVTLYGSFSDPRTNEPHSVRIVWQDGSPDTTLLLPAGTRSFSADHTYAAEGGYYPAVFITNADGQTIAGASEEQVLPAPFSVVLLLKAQPGQTVSGVVTDPATGDIIQTEFTLSLADVGVGEFLAAQLTNVGLTPTPNVVEAVSTYDFREHNLGQQDSVEVLLFIRASLPPGTVPVLLYLDPATRQEHFFQGDVHFIEGPNFLIVSLVLNNTDTPRLIDLTTTVFTVAASVPGATATAAVSASVASAAPGAIVAVQTTTFQSSSQLKLTLATTQLGQVSQSLSSLDGGGGADEATDGGGDDGLAKVLAKELEALWRDEVGPVLRPWGLPPQHAAPSSESRPPNPQAPERPQENQSREEAPTGRPHAIDLFVPIPGVAVSAVGLGPANGRQTSRAAPAAAYVLAAPLIGSVSGRLGRRKKKGRTDPETDAASEVGADPTEE